MPHLLQHKLFPLFFAAGAVLLVVLGIVVWWLSPFAKKPASLEGPSSTATSTTKGILPAQAGRYQYIEVTESCGPYYDGGACVNMRSGPGTTYPVVEKLRNGMVLKVASTTVVDGRTWYTIGFDGEIHYPERVAGGWYVAADYVQLFSDNGPSKIVTKINPSTTKRIIVDITNEMLYAYDGNVLFMQQPISTGLELTPTTLGTFWVRRKIPDSYMQGPIPGLSDQYYDLPGVPWDIYFTKDGAAIHGAYWHNHFGEPWSHGCVNLPPDQAKILYMWADLGTPVTVQN